MPQQASKSEPNEKLSATIKRIGETLQSLKYNTGFNEDAVVILLAHHTGIGQRTIRKIFSGLNDIHKRYCEQEEL